MFYGTFLANLESKSLWNKLIMVCMIVNFGFMKMLVLC